MFIIYLFRTNTWEMCSENLYTSLKLLWKTDLRTFSALSSQLKYYLTQVIIGANQKCKTKICLHYHSRFCIFSNRLSLIFNQRWIMRLRFMVQTRKLFFQKLTAPGILNMDYCTKIRTVKLNNILFQMIWSLTH